MAFQVSGTLRLLEYRNGKPVFDLPSRPSPAVQPAAPTPAPAAAPEPAARPARRPAPANLFGGTCLLCGNWVEAKTGERGGKVDGKWQVRHLPGQCPEKKTETETPAPEPQPKRAEDVRTGGSEPLTGYFSAQFGDDTNDYVTIRIKRQKDDARFLPGRLLVGYLHGQNNEGDYTTFANIDENGRARIWRKFGDNTRLRQALAAVLGDQKAAGEAWARVSKKCWRCSIRLTTPESLDRLMGDDCFNKGGF